MGLADKNQERTEKDNVIGNNASMLFYRRCNTKEIVFSLPPLKVL